MNSKKHKLPRRILAMLLAICMFVTMFPSAMFAVEEANAQGESAAAQTVKVENSDSNVSISKEATRVDATTWDVTMTVNAHQDIQAVPLDVVLVLDTSPSMDFKLDSDTDAGYWEESRLDVVSEAAKDLIDELAAVGNVNVGLVQFHGSGSSVENLTSLSDGSQTIKNAIDDLNTWRHSGTNIESGLSEANDMLSGRSATDGANKVVILLSDGDYNRGDDPTREAAKMKNSGIEIFSIGFADQGQAANTLKGIASEPTEDHFFQADNATQLVNAFTDIAYEITAMINDQAGDDVTIVENSLAATIDGVPDDHLMQSGNTGFRWNPDTDQGFQRSNIENHLSGEIEQC